VKAIGDTVKGMAPSVPNGEKQRIFRFFPSSFQKNYAYFMGFQSSGNGVALIKTAPMEYGVKAWQLLNIC